MKQPIPRPCKTADCPSDAEPRDDFCIQCQLTGKAPPLRPDRAAIIPVKHGVKHGPAVR